MGEGWVPASGSPQGPPGLERAWAGGRRAARAPDLAGGGGQRAPAGLQGRGKKSGIASWRAKAARTGWGRARAAQGPRRDGGLSAGAGAGGARHLSYLAVWGLLISSPLAGWWWWGTLDPQHLSREQRSQCSLGHFWKLREEGSHGGREGNGENGEARGEVELSRVEQRRRRAEGLTPSWEKGLGRE